jgi:hypothetical protein
MNVIYSQFQIFLIPVAISISLQRFDLAIGGFQFAGADAMFVPVQYKRFPYQQFPCSIFKNPYPA